MGKGVPKHAECKISPDNTRVHGERLGIILYYYTDNAILCVLLIIMAKLCFHYRVLNQLNKTYSCVTRFR